MVPHLNGRAVTLRRFPEGVDDLDAAFFEKRCPKHRPEWVKTTTVRAGPHAGKIDFCVCDGLPTLIWMAQLAAIELHPSLSLARGRRRGRPCSPSTSIPGPPADIVDCCRVALRLRDLFGHFGARVLPQDLGLEGHAGLRAAQHAKTSYDETKPFAKAIAQLLEKQTPDQVVSKMKKVEREGKVFVDWSQNHRAKRRSPSTRCAPASARPPRRRSPGTRSRAAADSGDGSALVFEAGDVLERIERARRPLRPGARAEAGAAGALAERAWRTTGLRVALTSSRRRTGVV